MTSSLLYKAQTRWLFHAHIKLKLSAFFEDKIFDELFAVMEQVDVKYNSYTRNSFIDQINRQAGSFVNVDATIIHLLKQLQQLSDDLDGEYDITVMPLIRLWGFYKENDHKVPTNEEISAVKNNIGYTSIKLKGNSVRIGEKQEIITGSFIKAFATDRLVEYMKQIGISDAIINAGGSTIFAINNESHPQWRVQVNDTEEKDKPIFQLGLSNKCYSTSSRENTYLQIGGKRYGHIISPKTGYPSENRQVGIVSPNAFTGDVISTGLFNLDKEAFCRKMDFLSEKYGVEGFLVNNKGEIAFSNKFDKYIV